MSESFHKTKLDWQQRCIYNPAEDLRWSFFTKIDNGLQLGSEYAYEQTVSKLLHLSFFIFFIFLKLNRDGQKLTTHDWYTLF